MTIQVLGSGCPTCKKLYELTLIAVKEMKLQVEVEYITDITKLIEMGLMSSPVLAVNSNPVMVGFTNDIQRIKDLLSNAIEMTNNEKMNTCKNGACNDSCNCSTNSACGCN